MLLQWRYSIKGTIFANCEVFLSPCVWAEVFLCCVAANSVLPKLLTKTATVSGAVMQLCVRDDHAPLVT